MKSRILVICTVFVACSLLYAKPVSVEQARKASKTLIRAEEGRQTAAKKTVSVNNSAVQSVKPATPPGYTLGQTKEILGDDGVILAYVTELEPAGFIITSADTNLAPVLGYSFKGKFPFEDSKQNVLLHLVKWDVAARSKAMNINSEEVTTLAQSNNSLWDNYSSSETALLETLSSATQWGPLVITNWHQDAPYNNKCPLMLPGYTPRCAVGCVATAMSQIINYWQYPSSVSFSSLPWWLGGDSYTSNGPAGPIEIDGDAGKDEYDFPTLAELNTALVNINYGDVEDVAYLCFAIGIKVQMQYGGSASGTPTAKVSSALNNGFSYGSARRYYNEEDAWSTKKNNVIGNIKMGWPCQIGILCAEGGHSVVVDGYRSDNYFHINMGWDDINNDTWYNLPSFETLPPNEYKFTMVHTVIYDICPYQSWQQYGSNQYNNFLTQYAIPEESPIREKWRVRVYPTCKGMIVGTQNNIYITKDPLIIDDTAYHPALVIINCYGEKIDEIEITQSSSTISHPVQSQDGNIYVGTGDGIYRIIPRTRAVQRIYYDAGNDYYGDRTPRLDESGRMYFGSTTTLICLSSTGSVLWTWNCPSGGIMYTGIPSVDTGRDNVYMGYWKSATQTAYLACINRLIGITKYEQPFSSITTADRGIHTPAIGSDGTVYLSVRTKIYALTPGTSSFTQKWMQDKLYARYQPIALGPDDTVYTEYWTQTGGSYYVTFAALNPTNGNVNWEIKKPDVGTFTSFGQPYCGSNGVVLFPVKWDTTPSATFELCAYRDNGSSYTELWCYNIPNDPGASIALGAGATVYLYGNNKIVALANGNVGDPDGGGMSYTDNVRPNLPLTPTPADEANDSNLTVTLSWTCSDPEAQSLKYSLFVGESGYDMVPVATDLNTPSYNLNGLKPGIGYAWKIIATDGQAISEGPTWVFATKPPNPDLNGDGIVNFFDFAILASHWMETCSEPDYCQGADYNHNGQVDSKDLSYLCENWLWQDESSNTNQSPVLDALGNKSISENSLLTFTISATDADGDTLTYSAQNLPSGATFAGRTFSWTPGYSQAGTYSVTFIASDGIAQDSETITITVSNTNRAPILATIGNKSVNENSTLGFSIIATDADGDTITYSAQNLPSGAAFASRRFTWTPSYTQAGTYQVTFIASDGLAQNSKTVTITVNNINQPPVLSTIGNKSVYANYLLAFSVNATDLDGDVIITYSATGLPSGATFTGQRFSWTPTPSQAGSYQVTFIASDGQLQDSETITITVFDGKSLNNYQNL